ncbi:MAG: hypothetical protein JWO06_4088, partial [Bacteroidota bacterium]|nr:hypothetical protein [Bacteroidota bacterium]
QPLPTVALSKFGTTCGAINGVINVLAGGGITPYQYSLNGGAYQLPDSFTNLSSATYAVAVKDGNGCVNADTISVSPSSAVSINPGSAILSCGATGTIVVNAVGGQTPYQYSLNGVNYQLSDSFNTVPIGFYTVQVQDAAGCTAHDTVTVGQGPVLSLVVAEQDVKCFAAADGYVFAIANGGVPSYQYSFNSESYQSADTFLTATGNYTVTVMDQAGCTATGSVQVNQPTQMVIDSIITTAVKCVGDKNGTITVYASGGTPPYNYSTTKDGANFDFATNGLIVNLDTGLYTVILSDGNGCTITDTASIPNAIPDFYTVTTDSTSCYGPEYHDGAIHVTPLVQSLPNSPFQYSLDSAAFQFSGDFPGLQAGLHDVVAMSVNGCKTDIPDIVVSEPAQAYVSILPGDTTLKLGQSIQLTTDFRPYALSTIVSYNWTPTLGLSCIDCPNPVLTSYARENTYTVTVTYNDHCTADASIKVIVLDNPEIFIPNSFTPNGDGNNDLFLIYGENIKTLNLKVFNRWGELVFESNSQWLGWDGTYKGVLQNPAVFVYEATITLLDNKKIFRKGSVTLLR